MFMISEFVEIVVLSAVTVSLFLGGFHLPLPPALGAEAYLASAFGPFGLAVILGLCFLLKVAFLCWFQLALRWTLPRFRYDQIQSLGWKILLPLALGNIMLSGVLVLADGSLELLAGVGVAMLVLLVGVTALYPAKRPASVSFSGNV
jgi:NADH-quinone oxidoreductase subunit H